MGQVNSSSAVPVRRSSARRRIVTTGINSRKMTAMLPNIGRTTMSFTLSWLKTYGLLPYCRQRLENRTSEAQNIQPLSMRKTPTTT